MKNGFVAKNGFFPKKSFFRIMWKKKFFCHKMIFSDFCILHQNHFSFQNGPKKKSFLKSHFRPFDMKNVFFFHIIYGKKITFAVKTTLWTK
jgi:hypothetical protein